MKRTDEPTKSEDEEQKQQGKKAKPKFLKSMNGVNTFGIV